MQSSTENKDFWFNLTTKLRLYLIKKELVKSDWIVSEDEIRNAFFNLPSKYRNVLELRIGKELSTRGTGKALAFSKQRAFTIEGLSYQAMLKSIVATRTPSTWEDNPLLADKCHDFRSVDCVLRVLPSGLLIRLKRNNYKTMHQVCAATPRDLMEINGVGLVAVRKLEASLLAYRQHNPQYFYD